MPTHMLVDKPEIIQALEELRARQGLSVYAFGNRVGISNTYATQLFAGKHKSVGFDTALKIADAFPGESRLKWLRLAGYEKLAEAISEAQGFERIPLIGTVRGGSEGGVAFDEPEYAIVRKGFSEPGHLALEVEGDSMLPGYPPGAYVTVKPTKRIPDNGPVVVRLPSGEPVIKRWKDTPAGPMLCSDNPDQLRYPPIDADQAEIIGVPVKVYMSQEWEAD